MSWWQYLLLVNIYLVLFYGFYTVLLRKETFFHLNRIYLVASALLSFFIPVIHSDWVKNLLITRQVQHTLSIYSAPIMVYHFKPVEVHHITIGQLIIGVYAVGAGILIARFCWQLISLKRVIEQPEESGAFSFFRSIRLGANTENLDIITAHEQVHASQWHSADILVIEIIAVINWFNPVVYFYRFGIKHIHEFIADRKALENGMGKAEYALLLLSQTVSAPAHQLVSHFFNHSLLRQRIIMLQKNHSRYAALLKYGLSVPLFVLMLILSSATVSKTLRLINKKAEEVFKSAAFTSKAPIVNLIRSTKTESIKPRTDSASTPINYELSEDPPAAKPVDGPAFITVEEEPEFKGGIAEFYHFLNKNLKYPDELLHRNIQGKVVISLTVEKDGSLSDIKVVKDIGFGAAAEAIRVLKVSPKWEPGYQNGQKVRVRYTLPISFAIVNANMMKDTAAENANNVDPSGPDTKDNYITIQKNVITKKRVGTTLIGLDTQVNPLYIVDDKVVPDLNELDPDSIESLKFLQRKEDTEIYAELYGKKALNGVVVIQTSNAPKKQ